jgi:hypothetical protein
MTIYDRDTYSPQVCGSGRKVKQEFSIGLSNIWTWGVCWGEYYKSKRNQ